MILAAHSISAAPLGGDRHYNLNATGNVVAYQVAAGNTGPVGTPSTGLSFTRTVSVNERNSTVAASMPGAHLAVTRSVTCS